MKSVKLFSSIFIFLFIFTAGTVHCDWVKVSNGTNGMPGSLQAYSIVINNGVIYTGTNGSGVYKSTDSGNNWSSVPGMPSDGIVWSMYSNGSNMFAGYYFGNGGVYRSANYGANWSSSGLANQFPRGFLVKDTYLFAASWSNGVFRSTNNGLNWTAFNTGLTGGGYWPIIQHGNFIFLGAQSGGVFRSSNDGASWSQVTNGISGLDIYSLAVSGNRLYAGSGISGVFVSTNNGDNWSSASQNVNGAVYSILTSGDVILAGTNNGFYRSTNNGANWSSHGQGLTNSYVLCLAVDADYIYAGTYGGSVYRRALTEVMAVTVVSGEVPRLFSLSQNYPNPFNPVTNIEFGIPESGLVNLTVYDLLGREAAVLVNESLKPGKYQVDFNASLLASGIYFYTITSGDFIETRKMILTK
jgi:hypothetical protein